MIRNVRCDTELPKPREKTRMKLLDDVTQRVFGGSSKKLVMSLLEGARLTAAELDEVKNLISEAQI